MQVVHSACGGERVLCVWDVGKSPERIPPHKRLYFINFSESVCCRLLLILSFPAPIPPPPNTTVPLSTSAPICNLRQGK